MKLLLVCLFQINFIFACFSQQKIGLTLKGQINQVTGNFGNENELPFKDVTGIKSRWFPCGSMGLDFESNLKNNISFETQLNFGVNGFSYKGSKNVNGIYHPVKGKVIMLNVEIPLHVIFKLEDKDYSSFKYFGIGPSFRHASFGTLSEKIDTFSTMKSKIIFPTQINRIQFGLDAFVGIEDSDNNSIRVGIYADVSGLKKAWGVHQLFVQYIKFF